MRDRLATVCKARRAQSTPLFLDRLADMVEELETVGGVRFGR